MSNNAPTSCALQLLIFIFINHHGPTSIFSPGKPLFNDCQLNTAHCKRKLLSDTDSNLYCAQCIKALKVGPTLRPVDSHRMCMFCTHAGMMPTLAFEVLHASPSEQEGVVQQASSKQYYCLYGITGSWLYQLTNKSSQKGCLAIKSIIAINYGAKQMILVHPYRESNPAQSCYHVDG